MAANALQLPKQAFLEGSQEALEALSSHIAELSNPDTPYDTAELAANAQSWVQQLERVFEQGAAYLEERDIAIKNLRQQRNKVLTELKQVLDDLKAGSKEGHPAVALALEQAEYVGENDLVGMAKTNYDQGYKAAENGAYDRAKEHLEKLLVDNFMHLHRVDQSTATRTIQMYLSGRAPGIEAAKLKFIGSLMEEL